MQNSNMFRRRQRHIRRALIQQHLRDSDSEDDADPEEADDANGDLVRVLPNCPSEGDLLDCRSRLQQRCDQEQCRLEELLADDAYREVRLQSDSLAEWKNRRVSHEIFGAGSNFPDTAVLERIREGRGPRDQRAEDLLTALRDVPVREYGAESYNDMRRVLLAGDKRVSGDLEEDESARESLKAAIDRRAHLLKASTRGSDENLFLEESSAEIL